MKTIDWLILLLPLGLVMYAAHRTRKYVRGVADFLSAGRICGRYVICVADVATALAVISLVATVEVNYRTGFAMSFWQNLLVPITIVMSLTGYCTYRFRETRAMSIGQFLEMRYNRPLRIFAASLRTISEMLANMICPAVAARFFITFLDLPPEIRLGGVTISTFSLIILITLSMAIAIIWCGGTLALVITDTIQGLICYPALAIFTVFILIRFSWVEAVVPVMNDRIAGESFLNPYDVSALQDFNLFALVVLIINTILNRASWIGAGNSTAGRTPHEQKMAGVLGSWRTGFSTIFYMLAAIAMITLLGSGIFASDAKTVRTFLSNRVAGEVIVDPGQRELALSRIATIPEQHHQPGTGAPLSQQRNLDTVYLDTVHQAVGNTPEGNFQFQQFRTLYHQTMLPAVMRHILPVGLNGLFCLLMVVMMLSTDDARIFSSALTITQDVIMPLRRQPFTPERHLLMLKVMSVAVGLCFFCGSFFMAQLDYLNLFSTVMCAIWLGGAGPVMVCGLYSRFGTAAGAFASLLTGMIISLGGMLLQRNWATQVYPLLRQAGWCENLGWFFHTVSAPLNPYIAWEMNPVKFPVNSVEISFIAMVGGIAMYCIISLLTCKRPFNLEKMLHRGIYAINSESTLNAVSPWTGRTFLGKLIGITPEYTRGDRIIAWSVFFYSVVFMFLFAFVGVMVWNFFSPWPIEWWGWYFLVVSLIVPGIAAVVSTVWFSVGGYLDLRRLFHDLGNRQIDDSDDGWVEAGDSLECKSPVGESH